MCWCSRYALPLEALVLLSGSLFLYKSCFAYYFYLWMLNRRYCRHSTTCLSEDQPTRLTDVGCGLWSSVRILNNLPRKFKAIMRLLIIHQKIWRNTNWRVPSRSGYNKYTMCSGKKHQCQYRLITKISFRLLKRKSCWSSNARTIVC